ncbi:MAG: hypothetical protein AAB649_03715 [Patescibacteria group bacterium]
MGSEKTRSSSTIVILATEEARLCFNERALPPRGAIKARYAVCLIRHEDDKKNVAFARGIGILYPDLSHLYFAEEKSNTPEKFWRGMYAASKTSRLNVSDFSVQMAVLIADETVPLNDHRLLDVQSTLGYDYSLKTFREEVLAQKIPSCELKKITEGFKSRGAELKIEVAEVLPRTEVASNLFAHQGAGIHSLALA